MKYLASIMAATLLGLATPHAASAAVVGEYNACATENLSVQVAATGNTWVQVTAVDAASLQNLDALVYRTCDTYSGNPAVDSAVASGMALVLDFSYNNVLPGAPAFSFTSYGSCNNDVLLAPGSPITSGPGGTLTDTSLDNAFYCSIAGSTPIATLPASAVPFVTTSDGTGASALGYTYGAGRIAVSKSQWSHAPLNEPGYYNYLGIKIYFINALAWALEGSVKNSATCASEGYRGMQLVWCQNICEKGYTGQKLQTWLHRWFNQYRSLPYCAAEGGQGQPGETGPTGPQ